MKKILVTFICITTCFFLHAQTIDTNYWDGKIYFKVKNTFAFRDVAEYHTGDFVADTFFSNLITEYSITDIYRPFYRLSSLEMQLTYRINFSAIDSVESLIGDLVAADFIEYAEKIPIEKICTIPPLDAQYSNQWALGQINAVGAWNIHPAGLSTGYFNPNVIIAVVDNEVRTTHEDIAPNLWVNVGEFGNDEDGNSYIGDFNGWDSGDNDGDPNPPATFPPYATFEHGTHVAGIAAGATDNGFGISSLSWNVRLMPIKATADAANPLTLTDPWLGVEYAIVNGADIINMSWGAYTLPSMTHQYIINAGVSQGIIFVAAAGNDNSVLATYPSFSFYPAMYNNVLAVGSTGTTGNHNDAKSDFSNYGVGIDVMAPGGDIWSSSNYLNSDDGYAPKSGTSMASPLVASLCGLMKSYNPNLTSNEIITCITSTCVNIDLINPLYAGNLGFGRINAEAAMQCLLTAPNVVFSSSGPITCPGQSVSFYDNSTGATATGWIWSFPGGTPASSTLQNPVITYNTPGVYSVTLQVTNAYGTDTVTQTNFVTVLGSCSISNVAQGNWFFGNNAGISFISGLPVPVNPANLGSGTINSQEATVSISDPVLGNLLFYSDATSVWDGNHVSMTNLLLGDPPPNIGSKSQILAVPNPANANQYYLFHSPSFSMPQPGQFLYSIVDLGTGTVPVATMNTNVPLPVPVGANTIAEAITAVPHCNGRDYWIIVHGINYSTSSAIENKRFYVYLLSPNGLTNKDMSLPTPDVYDPTFNFNAGTGEMKASPDGTKLALAAGATIGTGVALYDFNSSTGIVSNEQVLISLEHFYGISFDPSSSFLYATRTNTGGTTSILAWELSSLGLGASTISTTAGSTSGLQLGPDGVIYVSKFGSQFLGAIIPPLNTSSAYTPTAVDLQNCSFCGGIYSKYGLPNFIEASQPPLTSPSFTYYINANCTTVDFNSSCYGNYTANWNFGDATTGTGQNVTHNYSATGNFTVTLTLTNALETLTVSQIITIINPSTPLAITGFTSSCFDNIAPHDYSIDPVSGATYYWNVTNGTIISPDPSISNLITVNWTAAGTSTISVYVIVGACTSAVSSINVIVHPLPIITVVPSSATLCSGESVTLTAGGGLTYTWSPATGLSCPTCSITSASPLVNTTYSVTGTDANGCTNMAEAMLTVLPSPVITSVGSNSPICEGNDLNLTATSSNVTDLFLWSGPNSFSSGLQDTTITAANTFASGIYTVIVTDFLNGCTASSTISVTVNPSPIVTVNSPTICTGGSAFLCASGGPSYSWSTGQTTSCINVSPVVTTSYTITVTDSAGCTSSAISTVTVNPLPVVSINANPGTTICSGSTATLTASPTGFTGPGAYQWSDGVFVMLGNPFYANPAATTTYTVTVTSDLGCASTSSVTITVLPAPTVTINASAASVCNGDPVTLTATPGFVTYSWDDGINPTVPGNPFVDLPSTNTTYTVSVTDNNNCMGTSTISIAVTNCCPGCVNILSGTVSSNPTPLSVYCIQNNIFISGIVDINSCEIKIAPNVTITVPSGSTLNIIGSHLYSCNNMWSGILVEDGGILNIIPTTPTPPNRTPFIEDAVTAVIMQPSGLNVAALTIRDAVFNRNLVAITYGGYTSATVGFVNSTLYVYPTTITGTIFTCRDIYFTPGAFDWPVNSSSPGSIKSTSIIPSCSLETPYKIGNYSETNSLSFLKAPFSGQKSFAGIRLVQVGLTQNPTGTPPTYHEAKIGDAGNDKINIFDNLINGISAVRSNVSIVNCIFQNSRGPGIGINPGGIGVSAPVLSSLLNCRLKITPANPSGASYNNKFYDCAVAIFANNNFEVIVQNCDIRSTQVLPASLGVMHAGRFGILMTTNRFRQIDLSSNKLYNIEDNITFNGLHGTYDVGNGLVNGQYSGQVNINSNIISRSLNACTPLATQYVSNGIIVRNVLPTLANQFLPGTNIRVDKNKIDGAYRGIYSTMWSYKPLLHNNNTINIVSDPFGVDPVQFGISEENNVAVFFIFPPPPSVYPNEIKDNAITGPFINTNPNFRSIYTSQCGFQLVCSNDVKGTTNGVEFAGLNIRTKFVRNTMASHFYGYVLSNNGIIGTQGSTGHPSDNKWTFGAWPAGTFKTATLNSTAQTSKLYVRTSPTSYNPNGFGFADQIPQSLYYYSFSNGSLITASGPFAPCSAPGMNPNAHTPIMEKIVTDSVHFTGPDSSKISYIYKNKIYRILKNNPSMMDSSTVLADFYTQSLATVRETYTVIEDSLARGAYASSQVMVNGLNPQNNIEENYKGFFKLYLKHKTDILNVSDSVDLINLAQLCPFTGGDVIYQARAFYNTVYTSNIFFQDLCPENMHTHSMQINPPVENEFDIMVYPNPNNGEVFLLPTIDDLISLEIKFYDMNGKEVYRENLQPIDGLFSIKVGIDDGPYLLYISSTETGDYVTKRIIINK